MKGLHTHKVFTVDNSTIVTTGTIEDCEKYRESWPPFLGTLAIGENAPDEVVKFSQSYIDTVKDACFTACKEVNPNDPLRAAASFGAVITMLEECILQIQYTEDTKVKTGTGAAVLAKATTLLELIKK